MDETVRELSRYSAILVRCLDETARANDRAAYRNHLASVARWLAMLGEGATMEDLHDALAEEQRAFGWSYLSGESGKAATEAFQCLMDFVISKRDA